MDDSFYFSLLRVSIVHILKANGFDKCRPSTLNILTDIYINFFNNLTNESIKCSNLRNQSNNIELQDITQSLINIGYIKVENYGLIHDENFTDSIYNTKGVENFKNWLLNSDQFLNEKTVSKVPEGMIKNLIEKRKLTPMESNEEILLKKKQKHKERQQFYNSLKLNENDENQQKLMARMLNDEVDDDDEVITQKDQLNWFNYLIEKELKLGHDLKYLNTNESIYNEFLKFQNNQKFHPIDTNLEKLQGLERIRYHQQNLNKNDYLVIDINNEEEKEADKDEKNKENEEIEDEDDTKIIKPSDELINLLPYNIKYDQYLTNDLQPDETLDSDDVKDNEKGVDSKEIPENHHEDHIIEEDDIIGNDNNEEGDDEINNDENVDDDGIGGDNNLMFM